MFGIFIYCLTVSLFTAILYGVAVKYLKAQSSDKEVILACLLLSIVWPLILFGFLILLPSILLYKYLNRESNNVQK